MVPPWQQMKPIRIHWSVTIQNNYEQDKQLLDEYETFDRSPDVLNASPLLAPNANNIGGDAIS